MKKQTDKSSVKSKNVEERRPSKTLSIIEEVEEVVDPIAFVGELVAELMDTVMSNIDQVYLEDLTIGFVIDSYQKAVARLVEIQFYRHPKYQPYHQRTGEGPWVPNNQPEASWPDTWAVNHVPIVSKSDDTDVCNTFSQIELIKMKQEGGQAQVTADGVTSEAGSLDTRSVDLDFSLTKIIDRIVDDLPSNPSSVTDMKGRSSTGFDAIASGVSNAWGLSHMFSQISFATERVQLPILDFGHAEHAVGLCPKSTQQDSLRLPPLRTDVDLTVKKPQNEKSKGRRKRRSKPNV